MEAIEKLRSIHAYMQAEVTEERLCSSSPGSLAFRVKENIPTTHQYAVEDRKKPPQRAVSLPIHFAAMPNGQRIALLKTALTTACERNCRYCAFRCGRDFRRQTFLPDELAAVFMQLQRAGIVQGLFLSSGVAGGGVKTQDRLLETAEILRKKHQFNGYIHLKIMPGAEKAQVERGMQLADRVSVNLEAPTSERLTKLAPEKRFLPELLEPLRWVNQIRQVQPAWMGWKGRWPSSTTQFVVGAIDETDLELLQVTRYLHKTLNLSRIYFSGFEPVSDTPFEGVPGVNPLREVRLYQASFLIRDYGFDFEELNFGGNGYLPLEIDPKLAWAQTNLVETPVEINKADIQHLLRVPGIGPVGARSILKERQQGHICNMGDLRRMGINVPRAASFILINGLRPPQQLQLFNTL